MRSPVLHWPSAHLSRASGVIRHHARRRWSDTSELGRQGTPLDRCSSLSTIDRAHAADPSLVLGLWPRVVVCQLQIDLARVFALEVESMPPVVFASSWYADFGKMDVSLADQIRLLVIVKDGEFEIVVVGRVVYCESKFLVPAVSC